MGDVERMGGRIGCGEVREGWEEETVEQNVKYQSGMETKREYTNEELRWREAGIQKRTGIGEGEGSGGERTKY